MTSPPLVGKPNLLVWPTPDERSGELPPPKKNLSRKTSGESPGRWELGRQNNIGKNSKVSNQAIRK